MRDQLRQALALGLHRKVRFSEKAIVELFGSWPGAVERAGLLAELTPEQVLNLANSSALYSDEEVLAKFRQVIGGVVREGGVELAGVTSTAYVAERKRMQEAAAEEHVCLDLPSIDVIYKRLGRFDEAMTKAGLWTGERAQARLRTRGMKLTITEMKALLLRAALEMAEQHDQRLRELYWRQFLRWREKVFAEEGLLVPHPVTFNSRLESSPWPATVALVIGEWESGSLQPSEPEPPSQGSRA
jgi:hypothetical protein